MGKGRTRAYKIRHPKKRAFLQAYRMTGNVSVATRSIGASRDIFYQWCKSDAEFMREAEIAEAEAVEVMEAEAFRRAMKGVTRSKGVYHNGRQIATETVTEYSDTLLIFMLKARAPHKYRERYEISGKGGGPVSVSVSPAINLSKLSVEERLKLKELILKGQGDVDQVDADNDETDKGVIDV